MSIIFILILLSLALALEDAAKKAVAEIVYRMNRNTYRRYRRHLPIAR